MNWGNPRAMWLCHPEPKAKDLGGGGEVSQLRGPDPSLRCAAFRMTYPVRELTYGFPGVGSDARQLSASFQNRGGSAGS